MTAAHSFRKWFAKFGILIPLYEMHAENWEYMSVCNFEQFRFGFFNRFCAQVNTGVWRRF